jgi:hypothetical protein
VTCSTVSNEDSITLEVFEAPPCPIRPTTPLAHSQMTNHDEITVMLVEPTDGTPALVRIQWPTPAKC